MKKFVALYSFTRPCAHWLPVALFAFYGTHALAANPIGEEHRIGGFAIGPQAFSFKMFTLYEAIEKTAQSGAKVIEFAGRQKLVGERPDVVFNHDSPDSVIASVQAKLRQHGIRAVNYGVVPIPADEPGARKVFDFARRMGLHAITTESEGSIDMIEKMVREYDIRVGFHNHAKKPRIPITNYGIRSTYESLFSTAMNASGRVPISDTGRLAVSS